MSEQGPRFEALTAKVPTIGELEPGTRFRHGGQSYMRLNRSADRKCQSPGACVVAVVETEAPYEPDFFTSKAVPCCVTHNPDGTPYTAGKVDPDALPDGWYALVPEDDTIGPVVYRKIAGRWTMVNDQGSACGPASGCRPTHRIHWQ